MSDLLGWAGQSCWLVLSSLGEDCAEVGGSPSVPCRSQIIFSMIGLQNGERMARLGSGTHKGQSRQCNLS